MIICARPPTSSYMDHAPHIAVIGVQPLGYSATYAERLLLGFITYKQQDERHNPPSWLAELEKLYPSGYFHVINISSDVDFSARFGCSAVLSTYIFCSTRLNLFTIVFQVVTRGLWNKGLCTTKIRDLLVLSEMDKRPLEIKQATADAKAVVADLLTIDSDEICIKPDTCNVSIFIKQDPYDVTTSRESILRLLREDGSERISATRTEIPLSDMTTVLFGGRVHLIASRSDRDIDVVMCMLHQMQFTWYFSLAYLRIAADLHLRIVSGSSLDTVDELEEKSEKLAYIAQTIKLQNESAKASYEAFTESCYSLAEKQWGLEALIEQLGNYAHFFNSFIRNTRERQSRKADEVLNYILAALAIFGIVGFWADVLHAELASHSIGGFGRFLKYAWASAMNGFTTSLVVATFFITVVLVSINRRARHGQYTPRRSVSSRRTRFW